MKILQKIARAKLDTSKDTIMHKFARHGETGWLTVTRISSTAGTQIEQAVRYG
jgi:hypothetical protein